MDLSEHEISELTAQARRIDALFGAALVTLAAEGADIEMLVRGVNDIRVGFQVDGTGWRAYATRDHSGSMWIYRGQSGFGSAASALGAWLDQDIRHDEMLRMLAPFVASGCPWPVYFLKSLFDQGITTIEQMKQTSDRDLRVRGTGPKRVAELREWLNTI